MTGKSLWNRIGATQTYTHFPFSVFAMKEIVGAVWRRQDAKPKPKSPQILLEEARKGLEPDRKNLILATYWLMSGFLTNPKYPEAQKLVIPFLHLWLDAFTDEIEITEDKIVPAKNMQGAGRTNYSVEAGVKEKGGGFAENLPHITLTGNGDPSELSSKTLREFGKAVLRPHIVFTKVIQEALGIKGRYGIGDNRKTIKEFKDIYERKRISALRGQ